MDEEEYRQEICKLNRRWPCSRCKDWIDIVGEYSYCRGFMRKSQCPKFTKWEKGAQGLKSKLTGLVTTSKGQK